MVFIILLIIIWVYIFIFKHPQCDVVRLPSENFKFSIGDIILFHALDNLLPLCIGTYYTHVAIVVSETEIFEAVNPITNNIEGSGIIVCDIEQRLRTYRGYIFIKKINYEVERTAEMDALMKYTIKNCHYNTDIFRNFVEKVFFGEPINHGLNCGEIVYLSLIALNILDKKNLTSNRKHHLQWVANMTQNYLPLKRIEYNSFIHCDMV